MYLSVYCWRRTLFLHLCILLLASCFTCPAGTTASQKSGDDSSIQVLRFNCNAYNSTYVKTNALRIPKQFTIEMWVRHMGCMNTLSTFRTMLFKSKHLILGLNANNNSYSLTLMSGNLSAMLITMQTSIVVFNKWLHLSIVNDQSRGLVMYLYANQTIMQGPYANLLNIDEANVFIGTKGTVEIDRFEGNILNVQIFDKALQLQTIQSNFDRSEDISLPNTIIAVSLISTSLESNHLKVTVTLAESVSSPICCSGYNPNCAAHFDGIACAG